MDAVNPMLEEYYKKKDDIEMLIMLLIDFVEKTKIFANKIKDVTIACNRFVVSGVKITEMLEKLDEFKEFNATLKHTCMPTLIKMNSELSIIHSNICRFSDENSEINKQQLAEISMIMGYTHRKSFDNVFCKVKKIEQRIKKIQMQIQRDPLRMMTHERSYSDAVKELSRELCFLQNRIQMNEYLIKQNLSNAFNMSESSFKEVEDFINLFVKENENYKSSENDDHSFVDGDADERTNFSNDRENSEFMKRTNSGSIKRTKPWFSYFTTKERRSLVGVLFYNLTCHQLNNRHSVWTLSS
ncbi:hypothetical protein T4D_8380 [Trichinella pseudospiralis]|uniref:Uncharacterized protein n=1 Tax=Trichinella pseudospiralis TaxID=6337 RepID=A0A0V1FIL2_TRIPS|nr:hypothetical protein T4D_8380 [Trichinella pseudospiralis]